MPPSGIKKGTKRARQYAHIKESQRGGLRSGTRRAKGPTRDQLCNEARQMGIDGRSTTNKAEQCRAIAARKT